ncbi:MAG: sulfurtransferase TusA family protein [Spirochaetales bacterium]|nr:sulfurtransferase TusA family protein [Spirochaetales bacterium]
MSIVFYDLPQTLSDDIDQFEKHVRDFRSGELHPTKFKGIRVAYGVYEQRADNTFMVRIRCGAGGITPGQLLRASQLGEQYGNGHLHVTTRQEIQLHYVQLEDIPTVMRELQRVGLSSRGGGGNTIRNIMSSFDSGVSPSEVFDVEPYNVALTSRLIAEADSWNLPRKLKMTLSSSADDNANATLQDLGFIAKIQEGAKGFEVWVAGGMGIRPITGKQLIPWIPEDQLYPVVKAVKNLFHKHGDRKNKNKNRLRFLWNDLGEETFRAYFQEELSALASVEPLSLSPRKAPSLPSLDKFKGEGLPEEDRIGFERWKTRFVTEQKQSGLFQVKLSLILGDIYTADVERLAVVLSPLGDDHIRLSMDQNVYLRNIPGDYLPQIYGALQGMTSLYSKPKLYSNIITCTGAKTCKLGICFPRGLSRQIQKELDRADEGLLDRVSHLKINISGCPNSCGQHHVGDLGFFGRVKKSSDNRSFPAYTILGGAVVKPGQTRFAIEAGWIHSRDLPKALVEILESYELVKDGYESFAAYFDDRGKEDIRRIVKVYNDRLPTFEEDKNYFFDWGGDEIFSTKGMGTGECSAGIFDMIGVDQKLILEAKKELNDDLAEEARKDILYRILLPAARMLLVTRGVDARSDREVYSSFARFFIDTALVEEDFRGLLDRAERGDSLSEKEVLGFSERVFALYATMDRSMKFPGETTSLAIEKPAEEKVSPIVEVVLKDLRGVGCPMNFVKTKMALHGIEKGGQLEILLDDGAPIENVPGSVRGEGHRVLSQEREENHWKVLIEKV